MSQFSMPGASRASVKPHFFFRSNSSRVFVFGEVVDPAQVAGQHQDAAVGVENFGPPVGPLDRLAEADRAVIGQDDDVASS